jgi:hypothetical protein
MSTKITFLFLDEKPNMSKVHLVRIMALLPANFRNFILSLRFMLDFRSYFNSIKQISSDSKKDISVISKYCSETDLSIWKKAFLDYLRFSKTCTEIANSFFTSEIAKTKSKNFACIHSKVTLICVVKNDKERLKMMFDHHRKIGIKQFIIVDNGSDDGTREFAELQPDADIFLIKDKFSSLKKYGWINQIIARTGFGKWYLYVDSDELFVYPHMENISIDSFVEGLESIEQTRVGAIMIDMYSEKGVFKVDVPSDAIREEFRYFDSKGYVFRPSLKGVCIDGGPRMRVLGQNNSLQSILVKHPLFFFKSGDVFESAHYLFPYGAPCKIESALLHYKFLASDYQRYSNIAESRIFANGSRAYKFYIDSYTSNKDVDFMCEYSIEFSDSLSLGEVEVSTKADVSHRLFQI